MFRKRRSNMSFILPAFIISGLVGAAVFFLVPRIRGGMQESGMQPGSRRMGSKDRISGGVTEGIVDHPERQGGGKPNRETEIMEDTVTRTYDL